MSLLHDHMMEQATYPIRLLVSDWLFIDGTMDNHVRSAIDDAGPGGAAEGGVGVVGAVEGGVGVVGAVEGGVGVVGAVEGGDGLLGAVEGGDDVGSVGFVGAAEGGDGVGSVGLVRAAEGDSGVDADEVDGGGLRSYQDEGLPLVARRGLGIRRAGWDQIPGWPRDAAGFAAWPAPGQAATITLTRPEWDLVIVALRHWAKVDERLSQVESAAASRAIADTIEQRLDDLGRLPDFGRLPDSGGAAAVRL